MNTSIALRAAFGRASLSALVALSAVQSARALQGIKGQVPVTVPFRIPTRVAGCTISDSTLIEGAIVFTYGQCNVTKLNVFIYPLPPMARTESDVRDVLQSEVTSFKESLPIGVSRGWYNDYRLAFDTEEPVHASIGSVPGFAVATVFARGEEAYVSLFYIYALGGVLVKIRLTAPDAAWTTNPALGFPKQFIKQAGSLY